MDLVTGFPVVKSVDDNEGVDKNFYDDDATPNRLASDSDGEFKVGSDQNVIFSPNKLGISTDDHESKVQSNGSYAVEIKNGNCTEMMKQEASSSPTTAKKGVGLRKWRRIRRDVSKSGGESSVDTVRNMMPDLSSPGVNSSKRVQVYSERSPKGEGSTASTKAVIKSLDGYGFLGDAGEAIGKSFAAGTDSENSEDRSSKSSTAASAPRVKYERPVVTGSTHGRSIMSGKNLTHSTQQRVQQGKSQTETSKKARGERVKIEKENSQSNMESDLRSSNFVFKPDNHSISNGMQRERGIDYDGEIYNGSEYPDRDGLRGDHSGDDDRGYGDVSAEGEVGDSHWDQDPMNDPLCVLKSVEEALEKEVQKFKEIGKDVEEKLHEAGFGQLLSSEGGKNSSCEAQPEVLETANSDVERESEDIIKQKIEAEVECVVISAMLQKLRVTTTNHITLFEEQNALASEQTQMLDKLGDAEDRAAVLKKEAEKLESHCKDIAIADETMKLQNRVCKYTSCFFLQLFIFLVMIGIFFSELSPSVELIPT